MLYLWIKALHVISLIAWMAAVFYMPRLFVYHTETQIGSAESARFMVMEKRLLKAIMTPAMIATWLFGLWLLVLEPGWLSQGWLHVKLTAVLLLTGMHGLMAKWRKDFAADIRRHDHRYFRIMNEVPTVLLIIIVIMVIVKPF